MAGITDHTALINEIRTDPQALGYASKNRVQILQLLQTPANKLSPPRTWTKQNQYIQTNDLEWWAASHDIRAKIATEASTGGSPIQSLSLTYLDMLAGKTPLDTTDPAIVGMTAAGPYIPNSGTAITVPGMLDAFVSAGVFAANTAGAGNTPTPGSKDDLLLLAIVPASRIEMIYAPGTIVTLEDVARVV